MDDETDEILSDSDFMSNLQESVEQADSRNVIPWEEIKEQFR